MTEVILPFWFSTIISGFGSIGILIVARPALVNAENKSDWSNFRFMLIGVGLIYLFFLLPTWFQFYHNLGPAQFLVSVLVTSIPLVLFGVFRNKTTAFSISMVIFICLYIATGILIELGISLA